MTDPFPRALAVILRHEGGYADDPRDPGGRTMRGVTQRTWEAWVGHRVDEATMRGLTVADVTPLYRERYWQAVRADELPESVALVVFDHAVNAGPDEAIGLLQAAVGATVDGIFGPRTLAAVRAANVEAVVRTLGMLRRGAYIGKDDFRHFGRTWLRRVDDTEAEALRWLAP